MSSFAARVASGDLHLDALWKANFEAAPMSIALSFVYREHRQLPVVEHWTRFNSLICFFRMSVHFTNLEGDLSKVRSAIILGTGIPLPLFLNWNAVILGTVSNNATGLDPLHQLGSTNGAVGPIVEVFSLLAIATSYIGFVLGLSDFLADFSVPKPLTGQNRPLPYVLTLIPPIVLSMLDTGIFFKALDFAGTYGVLMLFGVIPAAVS